MKKKGVTAEFTSQDDAGCCRSTAAMDDGTMMRRCAAPRSGNRVDSREPISHEAKICWNVE